jgi:hypothetical protein
MAQPHQDEPAFPATVYDEEIGFRPGPYPGMGLRDWFAGQALAGLMGDDCAPELAPKLAYKIADQMMAQRVK